MPALQSAHLDDADPARLTHEPERAAAEGEQHRVCGEGGVSDEWYLLACIEESHANVVIRCGGGRHEGGLGMRELAGDNRQGRIALSVGIENDGSRITGEADARERIYLKNAQAMLSKGCAVLAADERVLHASARQATLPASPGVVLLRT